MKKRFFAIFLILALAISILPIQVIAFASENPDKQLDSNKQIEESRNLSETRILKPAYTEQDRINGFKNFSTSMRNYTPDNVNKGQIIGLVYDQNTGVSLPKANIKIEGWNEQIQTDNEGRFAITNLADGYYNIIVEIDGYYTAAYKNMPVFEYCGSSIYSLAISTYYEVNEDWKADIHSDQNHYDEPIDPEKPQLNKDQSLVDFPFDVGDDMNTDVLPNETNAEGTTAIAAAAYTTPNLTVFSVNYNGFNYEFAGNMNEYLYYVVANELFDPNASLYSGMTEAQKLNSFKAQAVAARTYADFLASSPSARHSGYTLCSSDHCQVFKPYNTNVMAIQAVDGTTNQIVYDTTNNVRVNAVFFASCMGSTKNNDAVWGSTPVSYLRSVSCPYDLRPTLMSGHGVGLCQDGAAGYAKNGYSYTYILTHYYTGTSVITATANPAQAINVGETKRFIGMSSVNYWINITTSGTYTITTSQATSTKLDTVLKIYNKNGTEIDGGLLYDDINYPTNTFSKITPYLTPGEYRIYVYGYGLTSGSAMVTVELNSANPSVETFSETSYGNNVSGVMRKVYKFTPTVTKTYTIQTYALVNSSDTFIYLLNSSGAILQSDDDGGTNGYSKLTYQCTAYTTYYIVITTYAYRDDGAYRYDAVPVETFFRVY